MRNERVMRWALALGLSAFAGVPSARAEVFETYTSGMPMPSQINMTNDVSKNAWLATNCYVWGNGGIFVSTNKNHFATSDYRLPIASVGMAYGFSPYAYNLGDDLQPPEAVDKIDWQATYDAYLAQLKEDGGNELTGGFVFVLDGDSSRVVAARGSVLTLSWVLTDGTTKEVTYNIAPYGSDRPKRIYWTDYPYNNQKVDLSGKFVKFFGKPSLVTPERITSTNDLGGVQVVENDKIVSGLYLNKESMTLEARGEVEGQVLMVYYSDGNYKTIQHMQVVEVVRPDTIVIKRSIGRPVAANGRGYKVSGLKPIVQAGIGDVKDGYGDYLYQHQGSHSYSEHNGDVYPIRPTRGEHWKAEVCWMEEDPMKVYWPFEIDQYESDWPVTAATYVRGDLSDAGQGITFPEIYTPTLMTYQEPFGHAKDVDSGNVFTTDLRNTSTNVGYSLVKLIGSDDTIAFLTVKSVLRSNTDYYTLAPQEVVVGQELSVDGVAWSAVSVGHRLGTASDAGPYVYQPGTPALNYDARLYSETNSVSSVYPISAAGTIEVWWKTRVQNDSMSEPVDVPSLPVVYSPRWPETTEAPQIVLASQKGSADETLYGHYGAATFDSSLARLKLPERRYFPNGSGTFAFWTRAAASDDGSGLDNTPSCLVQLGNAVGEAILLRIGGDENLQLLKAGQDAPIADLKLPAVSQADPWMHIALTIENGQDFTLSVNGTNHQAKVSLPAPATFLGEYLDACGMGCAFGSITNVLQRTIELGAAVGRQVAEVVVYDRVLTADEIAVEKYTVHTGDEEGLTGCWSFRPDEDLVASVLAGDVDRRAFRDRTAEKKPSLTNAAHNVILSLPGAPLRSTSILIPDDGTEPTIYRQNDSSRPGYNPNEEHAFVESGGDGYIVWALRCDLGKGGERQGVFAEYVKDGRSRLQFYHVLPTNDEHPTFGATCTAGFMLPGPLPPDDDDRRPVACGGLVVERQGRGRLP